MKKRLAVLLSGGGTNLQALIDGVAAGRIRGEIVCVISSNAEAYGIQRAAAAGIPVFICSLKELGDRRDQEVLRILLEYKADYIFLAGYLGVLSPRLVKAFPYRIVNIHPALLPKYGGKGFYGLAVHRAVLAAKEKRSGATVHFVDSGTDTGLIIRQKSLRVKAGDSPESLQRRILQRIEHPLLVQTAAELCRGKTRARKIYIHNKRRSRV